MKQVVVNNNFRLFFYADHYSVSTYAKQHSLIFSRLFKRSLALYFVYIITELSEAFVSNLRLSQSCGMPPHFLHYLFSELKLNVLTVEYYIIFETFID